MAVWRTFNFVSKEKMDEFLNGVVVGSVDIRPGAVVDGLTLIANVGAGDVTVTFAPAKGHAWTAAEIVAQIEATFAGYPKLELETREAGLGAKAYLKMSNDTSVTIRSTGTANAALGFSAVADTVGRHYVATEVIYTHCHPNGKWEWSVNTLV